MELTALALRSAAQKLRPYFQAHPVIVLTDQPLRNILHKPDLTGRMLQWAIELSEFGIEFQPRLSMKGQVMADFVLEYSRRPSQHHESSKQEWWTLRVDGASRSSGSGVGLLLQSPTGEHLEQAIRLGFSASNNEAEYEAILSGLDLALALSVSKLRIYSDSQLVKFPCKPLRQPSNDQEWTDILQNISGQALYPEIQTGTQSPGASCPFHPDWGHLYKRSFTGPYLRCLGHSEAQAHSQGYYWPTMKKDAAAYVKNVINVKVGPLPAAPAQKKFLLVATDYFSKWVEAEAYASIKDKDVTKFVWKNIVCRFGIPQTIIADNGPQFDSIAFRNFCSELNIRNSYSTRDILKLPGVLWAYRTTPGRPTGNTPFALAYGMDAVIPTEIGLPTIRTDAAKQNDANTELGRNLDWADEVGRVQPSGWQTINKEHPPITIAK
ncbi:hypothetical protein CK203_104606 [Vitis vinifera]|uniref:Integrase catalytic domain-containing protein n=1 Tax=Vitis vinifera TaxID=29760 RepID=A0A438CAW8_VITVI|nr:hypothetical protein CK203_104606 [Vitis vinifera]